MAYSHGGRRRGAGRPSGSKNKTPEKPTLLTTRKMIAARVLADPEAEEKLWKSILYGSDPRLRFDALVYLTDRLEGKTVTPLAVANVDAEGNPLPVDNAPRLTVIFEDSNGTGRPLLDAPPVIDAAPVIDGKAAR